MSANCGLFGTKINCGSIAHLNNTSSKACRCWGWLWGGGEGDKMQTNAESHSTVMVERKNETVVEFL